MMESGESFKTSAVSSTLNPAGLARINLGKRIERVVEGDDFPSACRADIRDIFKINAWVLAAPFVRLALARPIQQNTSHHCGRYRIEMGPMLPIYVRHVNQP